MLGHGDEAAFTERADWLGRRILGYQVEYAVTGYKKVRQEHDVMDFTTEQGEAYLELHDKLAQVAPWLADMVTPLQRAEWVDEPEIAERVREITERAAWQRALDKQTMRHELYMRGHDWLEGFSPTLAGLLLPENAAPRVSAAQRRENLLEEMGERALQRREREYERAQEWFRAEVLKDQIRQIRTELRGDTFDAEGNLILTAPLTEDEKAELRAEVEKLRYELDPDKWLDQQARRRQRALDALIGEETDWTADIPEPQPLRLFAGAGEAFAVPTARELRATLPTLAEISDQIAAAPRRGNVVRVLGMDPTQKYDMVYEVRDMRTLISSDQDNYPAELQPRQRERMASLLQVRQIAQNLEPDALLSESYSLDRGAMIIGDDGIVESGNGRVMALRMAANSYPNAYDSYRNELIARAAEFGIEPDDIADMDLPVLVRVRVSEVDRVGFTREANNAAVLTMSAVEQAQTDAGGISTEMLEMLEIGDSQDIADALRSSRNNEFVRLFSARLSDNERAALMDAQGHISQEGIKRISSAMFTRVFSHDRLVSRMYESTDNDIRNVTSGYLTALGKLARAEELVATGQRGEELSIADDLAIAAEKYSRLRSQGVSVDEYLAQAQMFGNELSDVQERILTALDQRKRSAKRIRALVNKWADLVIGSPAPNQGSFFGDAVPTKTELVDRWLTDDQAEMF